MRGVLEVMIAARGRAFRAFAGLVVVLTVEGRAAAQAKAPPPAPAVAQENAPKPVSSATPTGERESPANADNAEDARKAEARAHFEQGVKLARAGTWDLALVEFLQSRQLSATWGATSSAAVCLQKRRRYDEALEMFDVLLRDYGDALPLAVKEAALRERGALEGLVGTLLFEGVEPGATIGVDGKSLGQAPLSGPARVAAGSHLVRVYKEGFEPFEARVDVAGKRAVSVKVRLRMLAYSGRLRVDEKGGRRLEVIVDGNPVGKTPWEGALPVGNHVVVLRGEGGVGTPPWMAPVRLGEITPLALAAEDLPASIRIEPTPPGASVVIDAVPVGSGLWEGRLRAGTHTIQASADGFRKATRQVRLQPGQRELVIRLALARAPVAGRGTPGPLRPWQRPMGLATMGLGALGVGAGAVLGGLAISAKNESNQGLHCNGGGYCDATGLALRSKAVGLADASTAAFIAGGAALAGGVVVFATAPRAEGARSKGGGLRARIELVPGGLSAKGAW